MRVRSTSGPLCTVHTSIRIQRSPYPPIQMSARQEEANELYIPLESLNGEYSKWCDKVFYKLFHEKDYEFSLKEMFEKWTKYRKPKDYKMKVPFFIRVRSAPFMVIFLPNIFMGRDSI